MMSNDDLSSLDDLSTEELGDRGDELKFAFAVHSLASSNFFWNWGKNGLWRNGRDLCQAILLFSLPRKEFWYSCSSQVKNDYYLPPFYQVRYRIPHVDPKQQIREENYSALFALWLSRMAL